MGPALNQCRLVFEVPFDAFGLALNAANVLGRCLDQLQLRARRGELGDGLLALAEPASHCVRQ